MTGVDWNEALKLEQKVREIISRQQDSGFYFDRLKANNLVQWIAEEQEKLYSNIRPHLSFNIKKPYKAPISKPFKINGDFTDAVIKWYGVAKDQVGGPFSRVLFEEPNLSSDQQLKEQLLSIGWEPDEWNYKKDKSGKILFDPRTREPIKSSPKLTESSYKSLVSGVGPNIARYLILSHRKSQVEGLINNVRDDGCISASATTIGTPTYRFRHRIVVNLPRVSTLLGNEVRSLFIARPGRVIVGHDASGLEARCEAHRTYEIDKDYALELIHGDQHQKNADKWGCSRNDAKTVKYAVTYGAHPPKLAKTLNCSLKKAKHLYDAFWSDDNPLYVLKRRHEWHYKRYGYIVGLDGRKIVPRKLSDLINYDFQSTGAILMKRSIVLLDSYIYKFNIDAIKVADMHDEGQHDVDPEQAKLFGSLAVLSIRKAGEYYNLNIPLDAEYKIGANWADTH